jgi:hypothetical protein
MKKKFTPEQLEAIIKLKKDYGTHTLVTSLGISYTAINNAEDTLKKVREKEAKKNQVLKRAKEMGLI